MTRAPLAAALALGLASRALARVPCAGDGPPILAGGGPSDQGYAPASIGSVDPTALVTLRLAPYAPSTARLRGDGTDGAGLSLERARFGSCGVAGELAYRLVYEPWSADERARPDAAAWGRFVDFEVAWVPADWFALALGVGEVPLTRALEQPLAARLLPVLPLVAADVAPDRRLGVTADVDFGVARLAAGAYQGAHELSIDALGGVLLAARLVVEPIGPVGRSPWPALASPDWSRRPRLALGLSGAYRDDALGSAWFAGADFAFAFGRWLLDGELLYASAWPLERAASPSTMADPVAARANRLGAWLEQAVLPLPWLALALREEYADEGAASRRARLAAAVTLDADRHHPHRIRLQAAWLESLPLSGSPYGTLLIDLTLAR